MREAIDVCICAFRRESLSETLASIAAQVAPNLDIRVIVADNDDTDRRRAAIKAHGATLGLSLKYIHAPARNISIARNACLDEATSEWIAFIDDDEVARPEWLANLVAARTGMDVIFGVSQACYGPEAPKWIVEGDFHSNRISRSDPSWNGYTANVLMNRRTIKREGLRFSEALGQTGGEDTMLFFEAHQSGARFGYAPDAIVDEPTPPARASLRWLLLRRFRSGQIHYMLLKHSTGAAGGAVAAGLKAGWCSTRAFLALANFPRAAEHLLRGSLHLGVVAAGIGIAPYREYGKTEATRQKSGRETVELDKI